MQKLSSQTLPWPVNWQELFGVERPLIVEIGFGYATYLIHLAKQNTNANVIGLEIANRCLVEGENAVEKHNLTNTRIIHSTAETALHHLFEPETISQIHINFPDPWFKKRHGHRRLMQRDTLDTIVNRLIPGGKLYLATDILAYAEMSAELLAETPGLDNLLEAPWANDLPGRVHTKYESKARRVGRACYYFVYQRNIIPAPDVPVIKEPPMPHIVLESQLSLEEIAAQFAPLEHKVDEHYINLINVYHGRYNLLFEAFVKEPTIDQRVALILSPRERQNEYTIKLGVIGHPRPTRGMHEAVGLLGNWIVSLHPEARILRHKIQEDDEENE